jgi:hypothetical protein
VRKSLEEAMARVWEQKVKKQNNDKEKCAVF